MHGRAVTILGMSIVSTNTAVSSSKMLDESNRGFSLLQRMGWKQGTGLGRKEDGIVVPVRLLRTARRSPPWLTSVAFLC